jgi:hypothetical protein
VRHARALPALDFTTASRYAAAGLANVAREYPNHPGHLLTGPDDLVAPSRLHPIFFGSYDWHSAVHQHWMLARLVRRFPDLPEAGTVRAWFDARVTEEAVAVEDAYVAHPARKAWERPYGWAWLVTLAAELHDWGATDADAARWAGTLEPLAATLRDRATAWLGASPYPQRAGTHANSAFACGLLHVAATRTGHDDVTAAVADAATRWYLHDAVYPAWVEPSAADFLSPALVEADLVSRLLEPDRFAAWFHRFLPDPSPLTEPAVVTDRHDPQTVHLDGLNLSRAWAWQRIGRALGDDDPTADVAQVAARRHAQASLPAVLSGAYVGEHWLPTFAVLLTDVADEPPVAADHGVPPRR